MAGLRQRIIDNFSFRRGKPKGLGLPLVLALRQAMAVGAVPELPSDHVLLARFGEQPAFDNLIELAREHGMALAVRQHARLFAGAQFPYAIVLKDGSAVAITGVAPKRQLVCHTADGVKHMTARHLQRLSSGRVIGVSRVMPDAETAGAHSAWANLIRLAKLVAGARKSQLTQLMAAAFLSNLLLVVLPLFITAVYDRVVPYGAFETLAALSIGVVIVFAIDVGLRLARVNLQEAIGVTISVALQNQFYRKLVRAPLAANTGAASGVTALLHEVDGASLTMPTLMVSLLADLPFVLLMLMLVAHLGGVVVMVPLLGVLLIAVISAVGSGRAKQAAGLAHRLRIKVQDQANESTSMLATIKAARAEGQLIGRWAQATDASAYASHSSRQTSAWSGQISLVATQLVIAFTVVVGAIQISEGDMTLGNLAACVLLVGRIIAPANTIVTSIGSLANMRGAIGGFFAVIDRAEEAGGDERALAGQSLKGTIDLHAVRFAYPGNATASLDGVTLSIAAGERVGIIGRNGCGKSTLLKLLPRLYEPQSGTMLFDGTDSRQLAPQHLRRSISLMAQDTVLMNDTLRANICLGLDSVDPLAFEQAATLSGVAEFARRHPQGYSVNVGPRGEFLSGGERQAVGLARVLLNNPRILLLDEPTAAMDNTAENNLIRTMPAFLEGRTLILATHRMQLLTLVDRIIWMEQGRVVADGPKAQVLASLQKVA